MKNRFKSVLLAGAIASTGIAGLGYWYVFIAGAPQLDAPPAETNTGLKLEVSSFNSRAMGGERRYGIVLPPSYTKEPNRRYPVVVLLHGGHGDEQDYENKARLTSILHDLYSSKRLPHAIVVTPDGSDNRGSSPLYDPDYLDGPNGNVATLIGAELPEVIKSRYRTLEKPQFWAIGGLSSGAYGAFNIGLRYSNTFHVLFSHTGYFIDKSGPQNSPQLFVSQIPAAQRKSLRIYLDAGEDDHKYLQATQAFHNTLKQLGIVNEFRVFPGGHGIVGQNSGWNYWHKHLADSLTFTGQQFNSAFKQQPDHTKPDHSKSPAHSPKQ